MARALRAWAINQRGKNSVRNLQYGPRTRLVRGIYINLLLTEREGRTGEYWPEVVAVRTERSEVRTKTTEGQYSPVRFEQARLVSSLLYGTRSKLVYV